MGIKIQQNAQEFLSTPSARRATMPRLSYNLELMNFYPRPPRGGRRWTRSAGRTIYFISIHALREEGDLILLYCNP